MAFAAGIQPPRRRAQQRDKKDDIEFGKGSF